MRDFDFVFEEIPLFFGKDRDGKQQNIALISGVATISSWDGPEHWEIESVDLTGPLAGDHDVVLDSRHPAWEAIVESISRAKGDQIWDAARETSGPDPDEAYDRKCDEAFQ